MPCGFIVRFRSMLIPIDRRAIERVAGMNVRCFAAINLATRAALQRKLRARRRPRAVIPRRRSRHEVCFGTHSRCGVDRSFEVKLKKQLEKTRKKVKSAAKELRTRLKKASKRAYRSTERLVTSAW